MKMDTRAWRDFRVGDLFETVKGGSQVPTGAMYPIKDLHEGDVPRITVTDKNNGEIGRFAVDSPVFKIFENCISVSFLGTVFYHIGQVTFDMKVHCLKPVGVILNEYSGNFLVTVVKRSLGARDYTSQVSSSMLPDLAVKLPVTKSGEPDWDYMEQYMREVVDRQAQVIDRLTRISKEKHPVDVSGWGEFRVGDVFAEMAVRHKLSKADLDDAGHPVYSSDTQNNGILGYYDGEPEFFITDENPFMVVFGDHTKSMNIVQEDFSVMDNVKVLRPLLPGMQSIEVLLFVTTIWRSLIPDLGYARHWSVAKQCSLMLPVAASGEPDWAYMEDYMQGVMDRQAYVIDCMKKIQVGNR